MDGSPTGAGVPASAPASPGGAANPAKPVTPGTGPAAQATAKPSPVGPVGPVATKPVAIKPNMAPRPPVQEAAPQFLIQEFDSRQQYIKALVYAEHGVGKTFLVGTAADVAQMRDVIMINAESGETTLEDPTHKFNLIDLVRVHNFKQVARVYEFLKLYCEIRDRGDMEALLKLEARFKRVPEESLKGRQKIYRTVIIDSVAEVEAYCIGQLLGITEKVAFDQEPDSAEWAQYKQALTMMLRLVRGFRDLPMHVLMTAGRKYIQDEQKRFNYTPALTGQSATKIQGFLDMVGHLVLSSVGEDGTIHRRLWVQPAGRFSAKCRFSRYKKAFFDDPSMESILKAVGLLEAPTSPKQPQKAASQQSAAGDNPGQSANVKT